MQFKFSQYQYQTDAADAVCDVFDGQPLQDGVSYIRDTGIRKPLFQEPEPVQDSFDIAELRPSQESLDYFDADDDTGYRNADLLLDAERLLANVRNVQRRRNLEESPRLYADPAGAVELDVEMETGTGKTFVYTKTMFELNRRYGWSKFIIVVPSIAIREGVAKSLDMTNDYFLHVRPRRQRGIREETALLHLRIVEPEQAGRVRPVPRHPGDDYQHAGVQHVHEGERAQQGREDHLLGAR